MTTLFLRFPNPVINAVVYALTVLGCVTRANAAAVLSLTTVDLTGSEKTIVLEQFPEQCPGLHAGMPCGPGCQLADLKTIDLAELTRRLGEPDHNQAAVAAWTGEPDGTMWSEHEVAQLDIIRRADRARIEAQG